MEKHGIVDNDGQPADAEVPASLCAALRRMGLARPGEPLRGNPLDGGVSSDIWRIDVAGGALCIKRALPKLKVAADWRVPVERNAYEAAWIECVSEVAPESVPEILGKDADEGVFVMRYLDPRSFPLWKERLKRGDVNVGFAASVGQVLGRIHAATAHRPDIEARFSTDANFFAIRLEPYLVATAGVHPDCAGELGSLVETTARERHVLVHGDVSPKNILVGGMAPLFLDAECAWYGDPAFDVAFCLNHLLLKMLWVPAVGNRLMSAFDALREAYFQHVHWEPRDELEARTARLLPGLMLARVDGKSPVEYLESATARAVVREFSRRHLRHPAADLGALANAWRRAAGP